MPEDNIKGTDPITLKPHSTKVPYRLDCNQASAAYGRGGMPYGVTISSVTLSAAEEDGTDVTSSMIEQVTVSGDDTVDFKLNWVAEGTYYLTFVVTLSDTSTMEFNFHRVICEGT